MYSRDAVHCRAIVWLQNKREVTLGRLRGLARAGRDDGHDFRLGRIKHERVRVPRGEELLDWAVQLMRQHADRKAILEVGTKYRQGGY